MLYEALVEEIKRKAFIAKSMGQEFTDENYLEEIEKSMGRAQMGEVRTWGGKEYIKTPKGWRPKPKGYKDGGKKEETSKFNDKGGGKFELEVPGKGGAQISAGDGKFEVKVWDKDYKYITDDSKRHVFDSQAEAERFSRELLNEKGKDKEPRFGKDIPEGSKIVHGEAPSYGGIKSPAELKKMSTEELRELSRDFEKFMSHYTFSGEGNIPFRSQLEKELGRRAKKESGDAANEAEREIRGGKPGLSALTGSDVTSKFMKDELPKYNANLDPDNKISKREFKNLIVEAFSQREKGYNTPIDDVLDGKAELSANHLHKLVDYFWDDLVD